MDTRELNPHSKHIFLFGRSRAGKSTFLSALIKHITDSIDVCTNPEGNLDDKILINQWLKDLTENKFPNMTPSGQIFEIEVAFAHREKQFQYTFIELAGEDLQQIQPEFGGRLPENIENYALNSSAFLLLTDSSDPSGALSDNLMFWNFFNFIQSQRTLPLRAAVVLTKWDNKQNGETAENVMNSHYLQTLQWVKSVRVIEGKVFPFSIGKVTNGTINTLDYDNKIAPIIQWILKS